MQGSEFRRWAEHGTRHYGADPWQFLRELLQNARDAGARSVEVHTEAGASEQVLRFVDDGCGMSLEHARRYLFRLYASSKDPRQDSAGEFGIGFWTVLRFRPARLTVESRTRDAAWGVVIDERFALSLVPSTLEQPGTRVSLRRAAPVHAGDDLRAQVRRALEHYGRCLTVRRQPGRPLRIVLDGEPVAQGLGLDSPLSLRFQDGAVEGVVGLAPQPSVTLYARGLPVWQGAVLDELREGLPRRRYQGEVAHGLAPAFQLNGLRLRVDVQRRGVLDDRHLQRLHRVARRALTRLVRTHLRTSVLRSPWSRLAARARALWLDDIRPSLGPLALLGLALAVLAGALWWARPRLSTPPPAMVTTTVAPAPAPAPPEDRGGQETPGSPLPERYFGAVVDGAAPAAPLLRYRPPREQWFRVLIVETHDVERGFVGDALAGARSVYPDGRCHTDCVEVELDTPQRTWLVLPVPAGMAVDGRTLRDAQAGSLALWQSGRGEVLLERSTPGATLRYSVGPRAEAAVLAVDERARLLQLPARVPWPEPWRQALQRERAAPLPQRLARVQALVAQALIYDDDEVLARRYAERQPDQPWLSHVLAIGRGDCDVINGVGVLLLRSLGIPARLVVGYVGERGTVNSGLHAWAEYHDRGWRRLDLTGITRTAHRPAAPPGFAPGAGPASPPIDLTHAPGARPALASDPLPAGAPAPSPATAASLPGPDVRPDVTGALAPAPPWAPARALEPVERARSEPTGAPGTSLRSPFARRALLLPAALAIGGLFALLLWRAHGRHWSRVERATGVGDDARILSHMLQSALLQPGAWSQARDLFHARTLPLLGGGHLSLRQAAQLARARRLFMGRRGTTLVDAALQVGERVLDAGHAEFGPVARMLDGAIDLERLSALEPLAAEQVAAPDLLALRDRVQGLLQRGGLADLPLHFVASAQAGSFSDVDLERLRLPAGGPWPRRFIAVDVDDRFWRACARLHAQAPARACYLVLHHLLRVSLFALPLERELRRRLSRVLLEEAAA